MNNEFNTIKKQLTKLQKEYNQMNEKTEYKKIIKKMKWFKTRYKHYKLSTERLLNFLEKEDYIIVDEYKEDYKEDFTIIHKSKFENNFEETCEKLHLSCFAGCNRTKDVCYYLNEYQKLVNR